MREGLVIAVMMIASIASASPAVKLASHSTVSSAIIRLGDVANLAGLDAKSARAAAQIALGRAPSVGIAKYIPRRFVESRIHRRLGQDITVQGPERLEVKRRGAMLSGATLRQKVKTAIQTAMGSALDKVAEIKIPRIPDIRVPDGARARIEFDSGETYRGSVDATIIIEDGPLQISSRRVNATVHHYVTVMTVRTELRRGHRISAEDLMPMQVSNSKLPSDVVQRIDFIVGADARRRIRPGQPIRQAWFKVPPAVKRGQRVRLVAVRGPIRLSTIGEALNNAPQGGFVRVRNIDSRKVVTGRATRSGTVEMEF
ncbi:MAG: flagellar basal body P-ring formation chaperone FlgA [Myxococcota bacterium]|nr:flagellar basal body P-ring formation chaperone FlgA [Myxococcota bacterium]